MRIRLSLLASWLFLAGLLAQAASGRPLIIAFENYPPYEFVDNGEVKGINADVIRKVFETLGVEYEFKVYPFSRAWLMLKRGTADASPSVSYMKEREPFLFYTAEQRAYAMTGILPPDYLWITRYVFFINRKFEESIRFESYSQIQKDGYKVGLVRAYSYHPGFTDEAFDLRFYSSIEDGLQGLISGEIDLFPMDQTVASHILDRMGVQDKVTILPREIFSKPYLMVFSKRSDYPGLESLKKRVNAQIRIMRETGEFQDIRRRYLPDPEVVQQPPVRPLLFVCEEWMPFAYMDGDVLKGIDVEVTERIMDRMGLPYEIRIYPWSRAWMMAGNGKVDAVLSVSYRDNREEVLFFTEDQRQFWRTGRIPDNYLWMSQYVFFVKTKHANQYRFESYDQLRESGLRVGRNRDYSYDDAFLAAALPGIVFHDTRSGLQALIAEKIDLYPMDKTVGIATLKAMGLQNSVTWLPKPLFIKPYLAPFVKASDYPDVLSVMERFYQELHEMRINGELEAIREQYLGDSQ